MFAAASAEKDSHPELLHLKYCKAALSSQQSVLIDHVGGITMLARRFRCWIRRCS
jgi:hypothetical protein